MKTIPLTQGFNAIVDDEDFDRANTFKWTVNKRRGGKLYAYRVYGPRGKKKTMYLHRFLLNAGPNDTVDHVDGDGLNNRRANIRLCRQIENARNTRKWRVKTSSIFKGVCARNGGYRAYIQLAGRQLHLGDYESEIKAAEAYNSAAARHFGEYAHLNDIS